MVWPHPFSGTYAPNHWHYKTNKHLQIQVLTQLGPSAYSTWVADGLLGFSLVLDSGSASQARPSIAAALR